MEQVQCHLPDYHIGQMFCYGAAEGRMDIFSLLDELQAIARNRLYYTSDAYDRERYERLMKLTTQAYSELLGLPDERTRARFVSEIGHITPKVGADAATFSESGEILLSHEGSALQYWSIDEVPTWHATHERYACVAYNMWRSEHLLPAISD